MSMLFCVIYHMRNRLAIKRIFAIRIRYLFMDSNFFEIRIQKRPSPAESGSARDERQIQNHPRCHPDSRFDPCT